MIQVPRPSARVVVYRVLIVRRNRTVVGAPPCLAHLVDLAEPRPRSSEHERRAEGHLVRPVHQETPEYSVRGVAVLRHADEGRGRRLA